MRRGKEQKDVTAGAESGRGKRRERRAAGAKGCGSEGLRERERRGRQGKWRERRFPGAPVHDPFQVLDLAASRPGRSSLNIKPLKKIVRQRRCQT